MKKRFLSVTTMLAVIALLLSSCIARPEVETGKENVTLPEEEFAPASDEGEGSELGKKYNEYKENLTIAFSDNEETPAESFEYEVGESGVKLTRFVGGESIVVIPRSIDGKPVTAIAAGAFSWKGVRAVSVPDCVKVIECGAFADCDGLSTVRLPFIGDGDENCYVGYAFGAQSYSQNALKLPQSLKYVIIGGNVTEIADNAFAGCKDVAAISLPDSVETIGEFAFYECDDLVCIELGGVKTIGKYALAYCSSLYSVSLADVEKVGFGALASCSSMYSLGMAFDEENQYVGYIFGAESADFNDEFLPKSLRRVTVVGSDIPARAFASCMYITSVTVADGVTKIGARAFYACRSLTSISLPDTVRELGDDAYFACDALVSAELGNGLEKIGMQAFYSCSSLKSVKIPALVTEIKASTFYGCSALETVELSSVTKVGKDAFAKCKALTPPDTSKLLDVADGNDALYKSEMDTVESGK